MTRNVFTYATATGVLLAVLAGCGTGDDASGTAAPTPAVASPAPPEPRAPGSTAPESTAPESTAPESEAPGSQAPGSQAPGSAAPGRSTAADAATPATPAAAQKIRIGAEGPAVTAIQTRLGDLGYWNGRPDGRFGGNTQQAVYALQKAAGLTRDGVVGPRTQRALDEGVRPRARSDDGYVIEIDKRRQLLILVEDGTVEQVFNTSTGSYERYEQDGTTHVAATPDGRFTVSRQIDGWRDAPLGLLWRPKYFNGGIAVHGAKSVPPYPASHGCARLSIAAMNHLWTGDRIPLGTRVRVY